MVIVSNFTNRQNEPVPKNLGLSRAEILRRPLEYVGEIELCEGAEANPPWSLAHPMIIRWTSHDHSRRQRPGPLVSVFPRRHRARGVNFRRDFLEVSGTEAPSHRTQAAILVAPCDATTILKSCLDFLMARNRSDLPDYRKHNLMQSGGPAAPADNAY